MSIEQRPYSPQDSPKGDGERKALLEAVENTDISFFSPIFDTEYDRLIRQPHPDKNQEQLWKEALWAIADDQTLKRVGLEKILQAYQSGDRSTSNFSPRSRQALDYFISNPHLIDRTPAEK